MNWIRKIFGIKKKIRKKERVIIVPSEIVEYSKVALILVLILEKDLNIKKGFGEYKRSQVYAGLIKSYPKVRKSDLGLAVELAVKRKENTVWV